MTDIVKRLNEYAEGQWLQEDLSDLILDAADEIERLRQDNKDMRLWLSSLEIADPDGRVWKRAGDIYAEMVEKQESGND